MLTSCRLEFSDIDKRDTCILLCRQTHQNAQIVVRIDASKFSKAHESAI